MFLLRVVVKLPVPGHGIHIRRSLANSGVPYCGWLPLLLCTGIDRQKSQNGRKSVHECDCFVGSCTKCTIPGSKTMSNDNSATKKASGLGGH